MKFLKAIGYDKNLEYFDRILYFMVFAAIVIAGFFLGIYFVLMPFIPAIIVHIIYILFNIFLIGALKAHHFNFVKYSITLAHIIQLTFAVYLWFPVKTGFNIYYFMVPMVTFLIMRYDHLTERYFAILSSLLATLLFLLSETIPLNYYLYETPSNINILLKGASIITILLPMIYAFTKFSGDIYVTHKELKILANTDSLTKILNRRVLYEQGVEEFSLASKYDFEFSLILFDIDFFKNVNDQFGHPIGDILLQQLTELITENIRKEDIFSRYGGEEFALLLRKTNKQTGYHIAEKLLHIIEGHSFIIEDHLINITVSIGISQFSKEYPGFDHMMKTADRALYQAKSLGRNQVVGL